MVRFGFKFSAIILGLGLATLIILVSTLRGAEASSSTTNASLLPVNTMAVEYLDRAEAHVRFPGIVTARRESQLGFEQGGRLASLSVDVGDRVEEGQVLADLDTRTLQANLQSARAQQAAAQAQADLANVTLERQRILVERGHISPQRLDEVQANAQAAAANVASARASAEALSVQLDLANLKAPYAGMITARHYDEGSIAAPGAPVLSIVESGAQELRVGLPVTQASLLEPGQIYPVEMGQDIIQVQLRSITGIVDRQTRSVEAIFDIPEEVGAVTGTVGRIVLPVPLDQRGFWAPVSALSEGRRGLWNIYVVQQDETGHFVEPRPVEIHHSEGDQVYVSGSVRDGEEILSAGQQRVTPNQRVMIAGR